MKEFKDILDKELFDRLKDSGLTKDQVREESDNIYHDLKILKSKQLLSNPNEFFVNFVSKDILSELKETDIFLFLSSKTESEKPQASIVLTVHHDLAKQYTKDLYETFNFVVKRVIDCLLIRQFTSSYSLLLTSGDLGQLRVKQSLLTLVKRI